MFKSRIPLQTPIAIKLLLFATLATCFVGWSMSSEASLEQESSRSILALKSETTNLEQMARQAHQEVNQYRAKKNLPPLTFNPVISQQAQIHSDNMADNKVKFSHDGFETRVAAIKKTISYRGAAENVAYNQGYQNPVNTAVKGWIKSDGHRQNMEGNYNLTGIGVAVNPAGEYYFTQIFILKN